MAVSVLELDTGSFNGRVVVLQDVTELRDLQDRVREQERLAALGRLASGLAHEINTPLTGIASFAQMLGDMTPAVDPRAQLVGKLVDQSFRVSRIVANLHEAMRGGAPPGCRSSSERSRCGRRRTRRAHSAQPTSSRFASFGRRVMVWGRSWPGRARGEQPGAQRPRGLHEGSPVTVELAVDGEWAEIRVRDRGPGVRRSSSTRCSSPS